jgi:hypothetical protein
MTGRFAPEAGVGAEMRPKLIAPGGVGHSPLQVRQIDAPGDSIHMGMEESHKALRFGRAGTRPGISGAVIHANGFAREFP